MTPTVDHISPFSFLVPAQIRFGRGMALTAAEDVAHIGKRVLLVRGRSVPQVDVIWNQLTELGCVVVPLYGQGEPTFAAVEAGIKIGRDSDIDVVLSIGGGAVLDLGKALAAMIPASDGLMEHLEVVGAGKPLINDPLPHIAIPTTAGTGSEVTKNAVISVPDAGRKVSLRDNRMLPKIAICDPVLTDKSPASITFASGFDAVTQVIEPYLSTKATPLTDALCRSAIPMGLQALARLSQQEDEKSRDEIAFVSLIGGIALANAGLGAVHGLAGVLGGRFMAPHGLLCARLLGPVLQLNQNAERAAKRNSKRYEEIDAWMGSAFGFASETAFTSLNNRLDTLDLPRLGKWIGKDEDLDRIAHEATLSSSYKSNPFVLEQNKLALAVSEAL